MPSRLFSLWVSDLNLLWPLVVDTVFVCCNCHSIFPGQTQAGSIMLVNCYLSQQFKCILTPCCWYCICTCVANVIVFSLVRPKQGPLCLLIVICLNNLNVFWPLVVDIVFVCCKYYIIFPSQTLAGSIMLVNCYLSQQFKCTLRPCCWSCICMLQILHYFP